MYSYLARQPILNADQQLVAYELLFRDGERNCFPNIDPNQATSNILTNNHLTMGVEHVTGDLPAYINFHADTLIRHFPSFLHPDRVVIEILEDVEISAPLISAIKSLKEKGYKLALDDHDFDPKWDVLLPYIDIIKVDVLTISVLEISKKIHSLKSWNGILLAEKVEQKRQFEQLKLLGFTMFQGYFFARPEMLKQKKLSTTKQNILDLISHSSKVKLDFDAINDIFCSDPALTYKLLRFINSPTYGCTQEITSLKHALVYIGELELKKFIALLSLSDLSENKCSEIMRLSLIRAKFCEQISLQRQDQQNPPKAFLTGILSLIDGILDYELHLVLEALPIHQDIKAALRQEESQLSQYLSLATAVEQGLWKDCQLILTSLSVDMLFCFNTYMQAIEWADEMLTCGH